MNTMTSCFLSHNRCMCISISAGRFIASRSLSFSIRKRSATDATVHFSNLGTMIILTNSKSNWYSYFIYFLGTPAFLGSPFFEACSVNVVECLHPSVVLTPTVGTLGMIPNVSSFKLIFTPLTDVAIPLSSSKFMFYQKYYFL